MNFVSEGTVRKRLMKEDEQFRISGKATKAMKSSYGGVAKGNNSGCAGGNHEKAIREEVVVNNKVLDEEEKKRVVVNGGDIGGGMCNGVEGTMMMGWCDDWPLSSWWNVMEEQMLWGCVLVPAALDEMDLRFGGLCGQNEVVWEDDLWCLRDIKEAPNP